MNCSWCDNPIGYDPTISNGMHHKCYSEYQKSKLNATQQEPHEDSWEQRRKEAILEALGKYHLCVGAPEQLYRLWKDNVCEHTDGVWYHCLHIHSRNAVETPLSTFVLLELKKQEYQHFIWAGEVIPNINTNYHEKIATCLESLARKLEQRRQGQQNRTAMNLKEYASYIRKLGLYAPLETV